LTRLQYSEQTSPWYSTNTNNVGVHFIGKSTRLVLSKRAVAQMDDAGAPTRPPPPPPRRDTAARSGGAAHSNGNGARLKPFGDAAS